VIKIDALQKKSPQQRKYSLPLMTVDQQLGNNHPNDETPLEVRKGSTDEGQTPSSGGGGEGLRKKPRSYRRARHHHNISHRLGLPFL
jgi:hypothetical protein